VIDIELVRKDVIEIDADVLLLKFARSFHGADESVFLRLSQAGICTDQTVCPEEGQSTWVASRGAISARHVLFLGTSKLGRFRYREIRQFARKAIEEISKKGVDVETLATTVHGAGYGLDIEESFREMIFGFQQGLTSHPIRTLKKIVVVERDIRRLELLQASANDRQLVLPANSPATPASAPPASAPPIEVPKRTVFVAMPFSPNFEDVYQFGIYQTVRKCGYVCEKVDESFYSGSIVDRIIAGIENADFVIADLTEERPNVYLEVGYAWGLKKPVLLVAREGQRLHFDLSHHKCIFYPTIGRLAEQLEKSICNLFFHKQS
jgi:hypothetical protein